MAQGRAAMLWGVFAVCTALSILIFEGIGAASDRLVRNLTGGIHPPSTKESSAAMSFRSVLESVIWTLILWEIAARLVGLDIFIKSPSDLVRFAAFLPHQDWAEFLDACTSTGIYAVLGLSAGLIVAFILAATCEFVPSLGNALVSFTLVSQAVPIVALIPLYVGLTGRGPFTVIAVVISATFFAAFMSIREGFRQVPVRLKEVVLSAGASRTFVFWHVTIPAAFPFLIGASRLAAPRVFLGVTLAEYLATRTGLGALMFEARGKTDFGMMWLIAITAGLGSLGLTQITNLLASRFSATRRNHKSRRIESVNQEVGTYS
jgi:ABC-type nitrate/sulfonate/bicarbonate transport system permease component